MSTTYQDYYKNLEETSPPHQGTIEEAADATGYILEDIEETLD